MILPSLTDREAMILRPAATVAGSVNLLSAVKAAGKWPADRGMPKNLEFFRNRSIPEPNSGCWLWELSTFRNGYGQVRFEGRLHHAHRAVWIAVNGPVPDGLMICHKCDNRLCINPDHLYAGTHRQNMDDAMRRNRLSHAVSRQGDDHTGAKLRSADIPVIRGRLRAGDAQRAIAADYGVCQDTISAINLGLTWRHVPDEPRDAVIAEGRNRRLALMLTLMAFAAAEKPATDGAAHGLQLR